MSENVSIDMNDNDLLFVDDDDEHQTKRNNLKNAIRVSTIDNFQGEESDVVFLSMVRSNDRQSIGFLKVCFCFFRKLC